MAGNRRTRTESPGTQGGKGRPRTDPERGFELRGARAAEPQGYSLAAQRVSVQVKAEFEPASRAAGPADRQAVAPDDVIEIEFDHGMRVWMRASEYAERFAPPGSREAGAAAAFEVPDGLEVLPRPMAARGPIAWAIKSLKVLGIDLHGQSAAAIARAVEKRASLRRPGIGVYACSAVTSQFALAPASPPAGSEPLLVFLHGTASSTWGSFGELWAPERAAELGKLRGAYGDRIYALEHETMAASPIDNALALARWLPAGARVHLVSHSRGGLVGELLCRGGEEAPPFSRAELDYIAGRKEYAGADDGEQPVAAKLAALELELREKKLRVERFVRVACPALGTTLASRRLDRWLSVVGSVAGNALPGSPLAETFADLGDFVAAVIKERTDPATLPGLEAMMPESPFIRLVNWPGAQASGDLAVIAGDIEPDAWWARLLVWSTDRFYDGDHDLVVNTPSMAGGAARRGRAVTSFHKGPRVNHFSYFRNDDSARRVVAALAGELGEEAGFEPLRKPAEPIARGAEPRGGTPRPTVFLLPGIMGSSLRAGDSHVWVDPVRLFFGGLDMLRWDPAATDVQPTGLLSSFYGALARHLGESHRVIPFPFDWRMPIEREADRLAEAVRAELAGAKRQGQPIRILAHSMGGLVARAMIGRHPDLWAQVCAQPGARLVMLGTPSGGSHSITELLLGQSALLDKLALLDIEHDHGELLEVVGRFPGVLAMLPADPRADYFSPATWEPFRDHSGTPWAPPRAEELATAAELRRLIDATPLDAAWSVYVAGCADATPAGVTLDPQADPPVIIEASVRGDGRVLWETGIPPGVPAYYLEAEHGDLPAFEDAFAAYVELLELGRTSALSREPPVARGTPDLFPMPRDTDAVYPDEAAIAAAALGAGPRRRARRSRAVPPVSVRVVHGDLCYAGHPVAAGHYAGDTITSAERVLDQALEGALARRHALGLYPGALETAAAFAHPRLRENPAARPKGALVIGLGQVGTLSAARLAAGFAHGLREYALEQDLGSAAPDPMDGSERGLGISVLLIGTGAGGLGITESVHALLRGVLEANARLTSAGSRTRIGAVEFLELWEDRAIAAVRALARLNDDPRLRGGFALSERLHEGRHGRRRRYFEEPAGWWARLQIVAGHEEGTLRFVAATSRARAEARLQRTQRALVDRFIERAIRSTSDDRETAYTLFELLLPNELKARATDQDDVVLLLDEASARYPWELLDDRAAGEERPYVTRHGMVRQLETLEFRESPAHAQANAALVIGDPVSEFPPLPGARAEAEAVWRVLRQDGLFDARKHVQPNAAEVIGALYARPYRILHLAGHGVFDHPAANAAGARVSGMVIGDGAFLTPAEVRQMRTVPELVFINCCHLGRIEPGDARDAAARNERSDFHRLAANLGTEFIRMGVRAVIAAGWAVDDRAASTFASRLYALMLKGTAFGEAVKLARAETYDRHPQVNTWGAYQCYGDQEYRLVREDVAQPRGARAWRFVSEGEALTEIDNLAAQLGNLTGTSLETEREQLRALEDALRALGWLDRPLLRAALGAARAQAQQFPEAIDHYRAALESGAGAVRFAVAEQYANLLARTAREAPGRRQSRLDRIEEAMRWLRWLLCGPLPAPEHDADFAEPGASWPGLSGERLGLLAGAYRRKAWLGAETAESLHTAERLYAAAQAIAERSDPDASPWLMLSSVSCALAREWAAADSDGKAGPEHARVLASVRVRLQRKLDTDMNEWTALMLADCLLLEQLLAGPPERLALEALAARYREARKLCGPREFASALEQIAILADIARGRRDVARALRALRAALADAAQ